MTTKAEVLAAREQYERVVEAYLRERGWIASGNRSWPWTKVGFTAAGYTTTEAVNVELSREPTDDHES